MLRRMGSLTRRQLAAVAVVAAVGGGIGVAALLGWAAVTAALVGVLVMLVFAACVQLRRRVSEVDRTTRLLLSEVRSLSQAQTRLTDRVEFEQRRLLAAVENGRLAAGDRHQKSMAAIRSTKERLVRGGKDQTAEVEALLQLYRGFEPRAPMPPSGRWALDPTGLLDLVHLLQTRRPTTVLELGSGTSSVWIAYAIERVGGRLVSIDHDSGYADQTRRSLAAHALADVAEVRLAPLTPLHVRGEQFQWYDVAAFDDLRDIDLLVVDGPPGNTGDDARYPALHVLEHRLSPAATVLLDDIDRSDERHIVERWLEQVDGLVRDHETVGHQAVFTYTRPVAVTG